MCATSSPSQDRRRCSSYGRPRGRPRGCSCRRRARRPSPSPKPRHSIRKRLVSIAETPGDGPMRRLTLLPTLALFSLAVSALSHAQTPAVPQTMRAAAFDRGGGPEVLSIHTLPVPTPGAGEVLIAVHASGVAVWELGSRAHPNPRMPFPAVLGGDGSGTIVALGPDVHGFKVGDQVYGTANGFYAEYVKASADRIAHVPKGISLTEASVLAISGLSALQGIDDVLHLKRGETLIIHGASGAVGTLAIQLAKMRGAKVLATATSDEGLALA